MKHLSDQFVMTQVSPPADGQFPIVWQGWQVWPVLREHHNCLLHAVGQEGDLAVKFTRRDACDIGGNWFASSPGFLARRVVGAAPHAL